MNANHQDHDEGIDPYDGDDFDDRPPSKSMLKRDAHDLQELGKQLVSMPDSRLKAIEMPERLRDALEAYKTTRSHEGKRRQLQYVGKVMRLIDAEPLREAVAEFQLGHARNALQLHQAERWRAELLQEDKDVLTAWVSEFPGGDMQQLRALIRNARKDAAAAPEKRNGRAYRELFQYIKEAMSLHAAEPTQHEPAQDDGAED
jgi:ribosome-associated protein